MEALIFASLSAKHHGTSMCSKRYPKFCFSTNYITYYHKTTAYNILSQNSRVRVQATVAVIVKGSKIADKHTTVQSRVAMLLKRRAGRANEVVKVLRPLAWVLLIHLALPVT